MSDKEYGPHESWCDTQNNISTRCNCMASGYIEDIEKLKKQNEVMREALEFYGDIDHWGHTKVIPDDNYVYKIMVQKSDLGDGSFDYKNTNDDSVAGRKAREALKKVEEMG